MYGSERGDSELLSTTKVTDGSGIQIPDLSFERRLIHSTTTELPCHRLSFDCYGKHLLCTASFFTTDSVIFP